MPRAKWKHIAFPKEMIDFIEKLIQDADIKRVYGFQSVPEFLRAATYQFLQELFKNPNLRLDLKISTNLLEAIEGSEKKNLILNADGFIYDTISGDLYRINEFKKLHSDLKAFDKQIRIFKQITSLELEKGEKIEKDAAD